MKYVFTIFIFTLTIYVVVGQDQLKQYKDETYIINNTGSAFPYKNGTASYILRKLYGESFNKWVDIEQEREDLNYNYIWSMNNAAEYMIRSYCSMICDEKPQILNIALRSWLDPILDSIVDKYYSNDDDSRTRDTFYILINPNQSIGKKFITDDTIVLYHENPWCRAYKYLVIQHIISATLGLNFDLYCLSQDGSQQANLDILGNNKDYLQITKDVASDLFSRHGQATYMKKAQFFYPAFEFIWDTELDAIAGRYYKEHLEFEKKQ